MLGNPELAARSSTFQGNIVVRCRGQRNHAICVFFAVAVDTSLEVLALRQQVAVLKRKGPRPSLNRLDRFFWTTLRQIWPWRSDVLVIVKPETWSDGIGRAFACTGAGRSRTRGGDPR
jgi:hypothetical protein